MIKTKYYLVILFTSFCACNSATINEPPTPSGGEDSSSVSNVQPISITFPEADFTELNKIKKDKRSRVIIRRLANLIDAAPKGSSIYMSIFAFDTKNEPLLIDAIRRADIRNVDLHLEVDIKPSGNMLTVNKLKAIDQDIDIVVIDNDVSLDAINHNKFTIFSKVKTKTGLAKGVVFTSSENWGPYGEKNINNAVILANDGLYQAYLGYWKEMKQRATQGMKDYTFRKYSDPEHGIYALFYPKRKNGKPYGPDPIINILDEITDPSSTTIQIEMPTWSKCRVTIAEKLSKLMNQGAKIEVVVRSNIDDQVHDELVNLANRGAFVKTYNYSTTDKSVKWIRLHSKVMMIRGEWKGEKTNVIVTGSENYNCAAFKRNNENNIILSSHNFKHPRLFKRFEDNFNEMKTLPGICCMEKN